MTEYKDEFDVFNLDRSSKSMLIVNMFNRIVVHYGLWFTEIRHQMGMEKALELLEKATDKCIPIGMKKIADAMNFELENNMPKALVQMEEAKLHGLMEALAKSWLVNDGLWFQAVEFDNGMNDAKRCNDSCWAQFSPYEAFTIKNFLKLDDHCGLEGLKKALNLRMYSMINKQSIVDEKENSFVFQMNDCRVQSARKRKNLDDYPCKSAGLVEYEYFAKSIDSRITTQCIGCPPDDHPEEWFCAWRFEV
jgi:hypothetical protein